MIEKNAVVTVTLSREADGKTDVFRPEAAEV